MHTFAVLLTTLLAAYVSASPTPDLEKRFTKARLTQFKDNLCKTTNPNVGEIKGWTIPNKGCVDIDGSINGFNLALGTGPRGYNNIHAFSKTGCAADADMGIIQAIGQQEPDEGACIDANAWMSTEPTFYGTRINSVKFG